MLQPSYILIMAIATQTRSETMTSLHLLETASDMARQAYAARKWPTRESLVSALAYPGMDPALVEAIGQVFDTEQETGDFPVPSMMDRAAALPRRKSYSRKTCAVCGHGNCDGAECMSCSL